MTHRFPVRVYYEDTDAGGVVYYANYLKFAERARTEMLREAGISQALLRREQGVLFVVRDVHIRYHAPAMLDDLLVVESRVTERGGSRFALEQTVSRETTLLASARVEVVCVSEHDKKLKVCRIPQEISAILEAS